MEKNPLQELISTPSQNHLTNFEDQKKSYRIIDLKGNKYGYIEANPNQSVLKNKEILGCFMILLSVANDVDEIPKRKKLMIYEAMRQNKLTVDETMTSIWKAYGDPFLPAGQIEFRHLMKYISETRLKEDIKLYTYEDVLRIMDKENIPQSNFEITETVKNGKKMWRRL